MTPETAFRINLKWVVAERKTASDGALFDDIDGIWLWPITATSYDHQRHAREAAYYALRQITGENPFCGDIILKQAKIYSHRVKCREIQGLEGYRFGLARWFNKMHRKGLFNPDPNNIPDGGLDFRLKQLETKLADLQKARPIPWRMI